MHKGIGLLIEWETFCGGVMVGTYGEMPEHQDVFYIYIIRNEEDANSWSEGDSVVIGDVVLQRCAAYSGSPIWHKAFTSVAEAKRYAQYGDRGVVGDEVAV